MWGQFVCYLIVMLLLTCWRRNQLWSMHLQWTVPMHIERSSLISARAVTLQKQLIKAWKDLPESNWISIVQTPRSHFRMRPNTVNQKGAAPVSRNELWQVKANDVPVLTSMSNKFARKNWHLTATPCTRSSQCKSSSQIHFCKLRGPKLFEKQNIFNRTSNFLQTGLATHDRPSVSLARTGSSQENHYTSQVRQGFERGCAVLLGRNIFWQCVYSFLNIALLVEGLWNTGAYTDECQKREIFRTMKDQVRTMRILKINEFTKVAPFNLAKPNHSCCWLNCAGNTQELAGQG